MQREICDSLESFIWMTFDDIEPNGIPHVTLAADDVKGRFLTIFRFLQKNFPESKKIRIDTIHLFERKEKGSPWKVLKYFALA